MTERPCIRCHHPVLLEDGHLIYCSHCGAPQIFLSEELHAEMSEKNRAYLERSTPDPNRSTPPDPERPEAEAAAPRSWNPLRKPIAASGHSPRQAWTLGVHYALLSAGVALALGLLSLAIPPISILTLLWVMSAPILTVAFFNGRSGTLPPAGSAFAARLGLLTGLLVTFCCAVVFTLSLVLTRFVFHDAALLDSQLAASFAQQRTIVMARLGSNVQPTLDLFAIPEYRVGLLLSVTATSAAIYLFLSTIAGGVAGLVLRRRRSL